MFGTLLAGCAPAERAVAPELQPGAASRNLATAAADEPLLFITEVMADPNTATDANGEWFEIFNAGTTSVRLNGWRIRSGPTGSETHVITSPTPIDVPSGGYAVLARSTDPTFTGGITNVTYVLPGGIQLNNSNTDWLQLQRPEPASSTTNYVNVDSVSWADRTSGTPATGSPPGGASRELPANHLTSVAAGRRYMLGAGSLWVTSTAAVIGTNGRGTPGTGNYATVVPCTPGAIATVQIAPSSATVAPGTTRTFVATARDAAGCAVPTAFTWASTNATVATIDADGVAQGLTEGTTQITATAGSVTSAAASLTVAVPGVTDLWFFSRSRTSDPAVPVGFSDRLRAEARDANGQVIATTITYSSDTPAIATIDPTSGVFIAVGVGNAVFRATTASGFTETWTLPMAARVTVPGTSYQNHEEFGRPVDGNAADDLIIARREYVLSYNSSKRIPNWVSWNLEASHFGPPGERCECFTADTAVIRVGGDTASVLDYAGSGYDRGHVVRSADRTAANYDNAVTFYLSNIIPQSGKNNQGPWGEFEDHLDGLARNQNKEIFIVAGGSQATIGTLKSQGRVAIPASTWKIAVVMPRNGTLQQVDEVNDVQVLAINIPNDPADPNVSLNDDWTKFTTTVDAVEAIAGYDLLAALPNHLEAILESGDRAPTAAFSGPAAGVEGTAVTFTSTSTDPDVTAGVLDDALGFLWTINGQPAGVQSTATHTFADNGTFTVRLIVSDRFGRADTTTKTITVANVAPVVTAFAGATILRGETYTATGSFADPGADTWTATVNYGAGAGATPLTLSGKTFALSSVYATAGTFTVTVAVTDDDAGTSTRTATVTVETAGEGTSNLAAMVQALGTDGTLERAEANSLAAKLRAAAQQIDRDAERPSGVGILQAFVNEVEAMRLSGRLADAKAAALIDYARRVIASAGA
ncbi:hypothetical protein rosag_05480 [Roseisolibacter agri]|uniref:Uncharacterized protein n=1 Tax=Roseisolibacter agri TaxID=2014610 RepID=A0AA37PZT8_9BACT|nr:hypothetical protein rosag_05480 [Roseisolibacter agri]